MASIHKSTRAPNKGRAPLFDIATLSVVANRKEGRFPFEERSWPIISKISIRKKATYYIFSSCIVRISLHGLKYMLEDYKINGLILNQLFKFHS